MSFHEAGSDLSRLHRSAPGTRVEVDPETAAVLRCALELSARSEGVFDVTVGAALVARRLLPPPCARAVDASGDWRDIELDAAGGVRLHRPLWIDLGGIAKGHAVDRAVQCLRQHGVDEAVVNAGGDLRTLGAGPHHVAIDTGGDATDAPCPVLELDEAALASSSSRGFGRHANPHLDARRCRGVGHDACVSVVAASCMHADALTKTVLALGAGADPLLRAYRATAYCHGDDGRWSQLGVAA
jgi:thiamine biosynthesis lipoprotein